MRVDFTCVKFCSEEFVVCEGSGGTTRKTERGRDEGRASNGGHLECPKAAIVSVYALLAHTSPYTGRKTYNMTTFPFSKGDQTFTERLRVHTWTSDSYNIPLPYIPFKALLR